MPANMQSLLCCTVNCKNRCKNIKQGEKVARAGKAVDKASHDMSRVVGRQGRAYSEQLSICWLLPVLIALHSIVKLGLMHIVAPPIHLLPTYKVCILAGKVSGCSSSTSNAQSAHPTCRW